MRQLNIDDRTPPGSESHSPGSKLGVKRKPSREALRDDKAPPQNTATGGNDLFPRRASGHLSASRASPVHRFQPPQGSVSSTSSASLRNGSYASSAGLSAGGSSMTSMSSYDRLSSGGLSPSSEMDLGHHDSPYVTAITLDPSPATSLSKSYQRTLSESKPSPATEARKLSGDTGSLSKQGASKLQGVFMCQCCPKKPKRFDSQEELTYVIRDTIRTKHRMRFVNADVTQCPRDGETVHVSILPQPIQKQKRG